MTKVRSALSRANALFAASALAFASVLVAIPLQSASAAGVLLNRSLMVTSTVASDDTTAPNGSTYIFGDGGAPEIPAGDPRNGQMVGLPIPFR